MLEMAEGLWGLEVWEGCRRDWAMMGVGARMTPVVLLMVVKGQLVQVMARKMVVEGECQKRRWDLLV